MDENAIKEGYHPVVRGRRLIRTEMYKRERKNGFTWTADMYTMIQH